MFAGVWGWARRLFARRDREAELGQAMERLRQRTPVPVFWLLGKTQSGKTSLIKYLTGAERAEIGQGFRPCTRYSSRYEFPNSEAPLLTFLDTRGLDEPGYDPTEDLASFRDAAHLVIVTVKALDHSQDRVLRIARDVRRDQPRRPMVLVLTCLHEAYPQQQHAEPYPFREACPKAEAPTLSADLVRSLNEQRRRFEGLYDRVVAVDLTTADEGFADPNYGGPELRQVLLEVLPEAMAQTLRTLAEAQRELQDVYAQRALPYILGYSTLAATAGALPVPLVDLVMVSGIQTRMVYEVARIYDRPLTRERYAELVGTLSVGILARQASRELIKLVPGIGTVLGSVAGSALAGASTFALGKAFCKYYRDVHEGHMPGPAKLREYYHEQFEQARRAWGSK